MANTDFSVLLKTLLDKTGINSELEQVQKIVNKYSIDIMPELKTASLKNQMKAVSQEIANDFNKSFGTNLTGKDVFKAYKNQAKQVRLETKQLYDEIFQTLKQLNSLEKKQIKLDPVGDLNQWKALEGEIQSVSEKYEKLLSEFWSTPDIDKYFNIDDFAKLDAEVQKTANSMEMLNAKRMDAVANEVKKIQHSLDVGDYDAQIETIKKGFVGLSGNADEAETHVKGLRDALKSMHDATDDNGKILAEQNYRLELEKTQNQLTISKAKAKEYVDVLKVNKLRNDIQDWLKKNTAATKEAKNAMQSYLGMLNGVDHVSQLTYNNVKAGMDDWDTKMRQAGKLGKSLTQTFKEGAKSFIEWTVSSVSVMEVINGIKKVVDNVVELDDKLLELDKVSDLTAEGMKNVTKQAYELGEQVGKTGTQVVGAVTEFKRAGYDLEESFEMAEAAMVMTNVAEGITETSDAAGTLISILKGFNMSESSVMSIVDMLNSTSNQSPIGFDELAEGLERTAGTLAQSGTSIQQTIGLITAGYAQLRNVEKVSTSLITLSARLRGVDEDGEVIDGLSAELQKSFGEIGVAIENADGSLRNIYEIAQDYAKVLPTLTDKQKQYYAELAAGKRNVTTWNAITQQFQDAENATAQAIDSVGSASVENAKYLDSIGGKIEKFKSSVEQLSNTLVDSGLVKFFIDLGTGVISTLDGIMEAFGALPTIGTGVGIFAFFKNLD